MQVAIKKWEIIVYYLDISQSGVKVTNIMEKKDAKQNHHQNCIMKQIKKISASIH
jgi:hypothetical protein